MAIHSVNEVASLINQQVALQENIQEYLLKAEAIASVALCEDFLDADQSIIHAYLWALCDMISESKNLHERALNDLLNTVNKIGFYNDEFRTY